MQRLGHGAEVAHNTAGHGSRYAQPHLDFRGIESEQLGASRGGAERAYSAGRVPAVMLAVTQRIGEFPRDLEACRIGLDNLAAAGAQRFTDGENRRDDRRRRLAHERKAMIEVHGMGGGAVGECRLKSRRFESLANDGCLFLGAFLPRDLSTDFGVPFLAAGKRDAEAIPHRELRSLYRFRRDLFELRLGYEPGNPCGDLHDSLQRLLYLPT